ncbi:MAG: discoidin domain-containing protein [Magnetospirillum sp.]|nr:MAG: discoidin domain-containing protein [Magnetospirillum sp.]
MVSTYLQPDHTSQTGATYKTALDDAASVHHRLAGAFAPHAQTSPNMTVRLDAGAILHGITLTEVADQSSGTITAPSSHPRIDRVVVDRLTGAVSVITGSEGASPTVPAITTGKCPVAQVLLQTSSTAITNGMITDERDLRSMGLGLAAFEGLGGAIIDDGAGNLTLDINGRTTDSSPDLTADYAITWDASASALKKVLLSNIGGVTSTEFAAMQHDMMQLYLLDSVNGSLAAGQYANGGYDAYNSDTIGANSTNHTYQAGGKYYDNPPTAPSTSYANTGGSGSRTGIITVTSGSTGSAWQASPTSAMVDGNTGTNDGWPNYTNALGNWVTFDFGAGAAKFFTEFKLYRQTTNAASTDTWKFQGSNDNSNWSDITSAFSLGNSSPLTVAATGNYGPWRYVRLVCVVAGSTNDFMYEVEFKIGTTAGSVPNMTLVSSALSSAASVTQVKLMVLYKAIDAATLNTDFTAEATTDGTNWISGTLTDTGLTISGFKVLTAAMDTSAHVGTTVKYRLKTLNTKTQQVKGVALMVK